MRSIYDYHRKTNGEIPWSIFLFRYYSAPDQHEINLLLARLPEAEREILAGMLVHEVELGVFETLKVLEEFRIAPFEDGYEGSPFDDFTGRLGDWEWPE